jgi:hypothetical protein
MTRAFAIVLAGALAMPAAGAQDAPPARASLLFIDDLHLDFRQTPRTRALMQRVLRAVARDGDVWALVTTGTSSLRLAPTTDLTTLRAAVSRVTGNALKPAERVTPSGMNGARELQHRADIAYAVGAHAIDGLAAAAPSASLTVLYVGDGYDTRHVTGPQTLIDAAVRARATMFVIRPWNLAEVVSNGIPAAEWTAYAESTQASLRTLATETGGVAVFTPDELEPALQRLVRR